jgi:hypothetical protein
MKKPEGEKVRSLEGKKKNLGDTSCLGALVAKNNPTTNNNINNKKSSTPSQSGGPGSTPRPAALGRAAAKPRTNKNKVHR